MSPLRRLDLRDPSFGKTFAALVGARLGVHPLVAETVSAIVADVSRRGDAALIELTAKFNGARLAPGEIRVSGEGRFGQARSVAIRLQGTTS
ncbi:MAG: hypothetical protein U1E87_00865 [Alphaproteobacteria bacterium]